MSNQRVILVGGGTGGHAAPILAIYQKLVKEIKPENILVVGVGTEEERVFFKDIYNYQVIKSGKLHRYLTWKNFSEGLKFIVGFFQSMQIISQFEPAMIFSKGGFSSMPMALAAKILNYPYSLHESDIEMGKVNSLMSRWAKKVYVAYPTKFYNHIRYDKIIYSGPILREGFTDKLKINKEIFGFKSNDPILFITGGSQGSLNLSRGFLNIASDLLKDYNVIHQAGKHSIEESEAFRETLDEKLKDKYYLSEFLKVEGGVDYMLEAINCADLVVARAGSTILELAIRGKAMLLVPWKEAAQDHQRKNAAYFQKNEAAMVISDDKIKTKEFSEKINQIFQNREKVRLALAEKAKDLVPGDGLERVVKDLLKEVR